MYWSSPSLMAPTGQVSAHAPQVMQASVILKAIYCTPFVLMTMLIIAQALEGVSSFIITLWFPKGPP
jgi:hypothetical protein